MPGPEDVFSVVGYTRDVIVDGGLLRLMTLSDKVLRRMLELYQKFGPLVRTVSDGRVVRELIEIYLVSPLDSEGTEDLRDQYGGDYQVIHFFNDVALRLCGEHQILLPPVIGHTTRAQLPPELGIVMRFPSYAPRL